jgi:integrase
MKLTATQVDRARPREKEYKMADGRGLALLVKPSGTRSWVLRYRRAGGAEAKFTIGTYPEISLAKAREQALAARSKISNGEDPVVSRKRARAGTQIVTFRETTERFLAGRTRWSGGHRARFRNRMERDVWPRIGGLPVGDIEAIDVMLAIQPILDRRAIDTAKRVVGMIGQVMTFAVTLGLVRSNPEQGLSTALIDTPLPVHRAAIVHDHDMLGRMLDDLWEWDGGTIAKPLLQFLALTFVRPGEARHMRWSDIDGTIWRYEVSKTGVIQTVPLCRQALAVIDDARRMQSRSSDYVFASPTTGKPVSDVMPMKILRKIGWADVQSAHGFRAVARTELVETLDVDRGLVEFQLSHRSAEIHGSAYDRTSMLGKRTEMMQAWGDWLDSLRHRARARRLGVAQVS